MSTHGTDVTTEAFTCASNSSSYIEESNPMDAPRVTRRERGRPKKTEANKTGKFDLNDLQWTSNIPECPVYHPSEQEFEDPFVYIQKIASEASKFGICKIVSPIIASVPAVDVLTKEKKDFKFETYVQPRRLSGRKKKDQITISISGRNYTYHEFEVHANETFLSRFHSFGDLSSSYLEKEFWREMSHGGKGTVEYGLNVEDSAFSCDPNDKLAISKWNLKNFSRQPQSMLRLVDNEMPGITEPMIYIGMLFSMFAWHVEDQYLYSINYHHSGANKIWYGVPAHAASAFENVVLNNVYCNKILSKQGEDGAFQLLRHKTTMIPPNMLLTNDVEVYKAVQKPGEFVITFPRAYHAGFSTGFNCGEAVNFATGDWFALGTEASKRYAHLKMCPVIAYEELLCKEAMEIYKSLKVGGSKIKPNDLTPHRATALSFMHVMKFYKETLLKLNDSKESSNTMDTLTCHDCLDCYRDSYVAYLVCEYCQIYPICLHHGQRCWCGRKYSIFKRDGMLEMEDAVKTFEQEKDIKPKVEGGKMNCSCEANTLSLSCIFSIAKNDGMQDLQHNWHSSGRTWVESGGPSERSHPTK